MCRIHGNMIITTSDTVPGHTIEKTIGYVSGNSVKARHVGSTLLASLKTIVGGDINQFATLMKDTRQQAINRMMEEAQAKGANAIVCMRLATSEIAQGCSELCAYGTAVVISTSAPQGGQA